MTKQSKFFSHPLLVSAIIKYQQQQNLKSFSSAATELLAIGIEYWMQNLASPVDAHWGTDSQQHAALLEEFQAWRRQVMQETGWDGFADLSDEQCQQLTFERFILLKVAPQHGGRRTGAGRKPTTNAASDESGSG